MSSTLFNTSKKWMNKLGITAKASIIRIVDPSDQHKPAGGVAVETMPSVS